MLEILEQKSNIMTKYLSNCTINVKAYSSLTFVTHYEVISTLYLCVFIYNQRTNIYIYTNVYEKQSEKLKKESENRNQISFPFSSKTKAEIDSTFSRRFHPC